MIKPSIRRIATRAGVSVGTVSRVLNGADNVDAGLREKTLQAMRELNYLPERRTGTAATEVATRPARNWTVGIVYFGAREVVEGNMLTNYTVAMIERACRAAGYHAIVEVAAPESRQLPASVAAGKVDGVLCANLDQATDDDVFRLLAATPLVSFYNYHPLAAVPQCCVDDYGSGAVAAREVLQAGHREIAFLNHQPTHYGFKFRGRAIFDLLERAGCVRPENFLLEDVVNPAHPSNDRPPEMGLLADRLLALNPRPTAVIVANDWAAAGLYRALRQRGVRPGDDLSLVGFDNFSGAPTVLDPPLSTVEIPFREIAENAVAVLIDWIDTGVAKPGIRMVPGHFIARESLRPGPFA